LDYKIYFIEKISNKLILRLAMKLLTRPEELVLLSVWRLKEDAYCLPIKKHLVRTTGQNWVFGAVYVPLDRLEKKGYLKSYLGEPTPERGGKRKRLYRVTKEGIKALLEIKRVEKSSWDEISETALEKLI
jgi:DNA-binding PadR family transcriptional regulator